MTDIADIQKDIGLVKNRIRALQNETIHTIAIRPTGEVVIVDKGKLETLNSEIDRLTTLSQNNEAVLTQLLSITGGATVEDLTTQKRKLDDYIQKIKDILRFDLATLMRTSPGLTLENIGNDPKAQRLQADAQAVFDREVPELERITALLTQADEVLGGYLPSGLKEAIPQHTPFVGGF